MSHVRQLPTELQSHIYDYVYDSLTLSRLCLVNRQTNAVANPIL